MAGQSVSGRHSGCTGFLAAGVHPLRVVGAGDPQHGPGNREARLRPCGGNGACAQRRGGTVMLRKLITICARSPGTPPSPVASESGGRENEDAPLRRLDLGAPLAQLSPVSTPPSMVWSDWMSAVTASRLVSDRPAAARVRARTFGSRRIRASSIWSMPKSYSSSKK